MSVTIANRDVELLSPTFKEKVIAFLQECPQIFITEGYRTKERQNYLYASGRTRKGAIITWTTNSEHTKGTAIDIAFYGEELYPRDINKWKEVAKVAKKYGIDWGYDLWKCDKPHFQNNNTIPDINKLTNYQMEKEFQNTIQNKLCDSIALSLSALWNFVDENEQSKVAELKKQVELFKN